MDFSCDACGAAYFVPDEKVPARGFKVRCKGCEHLIVVRIAAPRPAAERGAAAAPTPPPVSPPALDDEPELHWVAAGTGSFGLEVAAPPPAHRPEPMPAAEPAPDWNPIPHGEPMPAWEPGARPAGESAARAAPVAEPAPKAEVVPEPGPGTAPPPIPPPLPAETEPALGDELPAALAAMPSPEIPALREPQPLPDLLPAEEPPALPPPPAPEEQLPDVRQFRPSLAWTKYLIAAAAVALYVHGIWKLSGSSAPVPPQPEKVVAATPPAPAPETTPPAPAPEVAPPAPAAPPPAPEPQPAVAAPEPPAASPLPSRPPERRPAATRRRAVAAREAPPPAARQDRILLQLMERKSDAEVEAQVEPEELDKPAPFLDTEQAARTVGRQQRAFEACASSALRRNPALVRNRKVTMAVVVASTGRVTQASVDDPDIDADPLGLCLKSACRRMVFPPFDGPPVLVEVPLALGKGQ